MKSTKEERKNKFLTYGTLLIASILTTFFMLPFNLTNLPKLKVGQVSPVDVRSPVSVKVENRKATERLRKEAVKKVLPVVEYRPENEKRAEEKIKELPFLSDEQKKILKEIVSSYYKKGIVSNIPPGYREITVVYAPGKKERRRVDSFLSQGEVKKLLKEDLSKFIKEKELVEKTVNSLKIEPNFVFNRERSSLLWEKARESVKPVIVELKKGEVILRKGEKVTPEAALKLEALREAKDRGKSLNKYLSLFILSLILYYSVIRLYRIISPSALNPKNLIFSFSVITLDVFLIKFFTFLAKLVSQSLNLPVEESLIYVPVVTSVIFASMFINKKVAVIHSVPVAFISGFTLSKPFFLIIPVAVGSFFSAFDSRKFKSREVIYKAAFKGFTVSVVVNLLLYFYLFGEELRGELWFEPLLILAGALITAVVVSGLSPIIINLFHFTTDIVYMELINLNHPLLRKLILKAPGTYSHSVMVATLAEAAAEAIGANALLAKAGGLFHDIGKLKNPQAFIENQMGGVNIHDKLPPEKSAAILRSHVEYGEELGKKYGLPQKVIDIIRQHHGTKLMKYFYHKAKELYGEDKVDEKKFRYPGPKPQFKESGIVMLADTVEAAVRSMKDSGKEFNLDKVIHRLIMETVEDGQLNQSGLSLKDIGLIEKVFKKVLSGIYHNRIEYPEDEKSSTGNNGSSKGNRIRP
ncbi:HD family phosphohydrolase [Thermovibrio sp.]